MRFCGVQKFGKQIICCMVFNVTDVVISKENPDWTLFARSVAIGRRRQTVIFSLDRLKIKFLFGTF